MPTARSFASRCPARAALAGNPSDGYGGAVVGLPVDELGAIVTTTESPEFTVAATDAELERLLHATAQEFAATVGPLPPATMSASTTIPRSVGLAGSSAVVIAGLRALAAWSDHRWEAIELAETALRVERDRLGIEAGLQDRLVQATGRLSAMTFRPVTVDTFDPRAEEWLTERLYVAWSGDAAEPSGTTHRSLRRRFDAGDPDVHFAIRQLAEQAAFARRGIESGDLELVGGAMNRTFDIRAGIFDVGDAQRTLVATGRDAGAAVNSAGSGGSVIGLVRSPRDVDALRRAHVAAGAEFLALC